MNIINFDAWNIVANFMAKICELIQAPYF
jgi:hypothetical protein